MAIDKQRDKKQTPGDRGRDRGPERGGDRGQNRGGDRGKDRGPERSSERGQDRDRSQGVSERPRGERRTGKPDPRKRPAEPVVAAALTETMRIAKALARAGLCSRRDAERWITDGRVAVNGKVLVSPALDVGPGDKIVVDGNPLPGAEPPKLWRYHKPKGVVTTHKDPEGRATVFDALPAELGRVISIGRLDYNSEGLLLLTNDGALARFMELPATGWLRRYRVRAFGRVIQADLDKLKDGVEIEGLQYGPIEAFLDKDQGSNVWLTIGLREGKNREVRKILAHLGLDVNRLIRISFGPFQLLDLPPGDVDSVKRRVLIDQLGPKVAGELGLDRGSDGEGEPSDGTRAQQQKPDRKQGPQPPKSGGERREPRSRETRNPDGRNRDARSPETGNRDRRPKGRKP